MDYKRQIQRDFLKVYYIYISQIKVHFGALNFKLEREVEILKMVSILGSPALGLLGSPGSTDLPSSLIRSLVG